ncbi:MAG: hypothetical protein AVDCRST_MAG39-1069 [uncultured Sphingomonadaceae bacterium]|uniref:Uncharacterized protein n=1 Tax=uncultured Sphingomonadaceae bacterium TaxID=169976 RepID=A0A6J4SEW5_9SPHN|nr:MAG: hypothetical protein AVDCRST_MAG39-1069 [uncultured Sphingomonadaceae bacterium]
MSRAPFRPRAVYRHWTPVATQWADNDAYGHVNNAVHYRWFDTAVNGWLIGRGLLDVTSGDPIGLVVETGCRYAAPLTYPEPAEVGLSVEEVGRSSVRFLLGVFAPEAERAAAEGFFVHVYVRRADRRPVPVPDAWRAALAEIAA